MNATPVRLVVSLLLAMLVMTSCSRSEEIKAAPRSTTTWAVTDTSIVDGININDGSAGAKQMQEFVDSLLASNNPCFILTQRDNAEVSMDSSALNSAAVRKVLADGMQDVYTHLETLISESDTKAAVAAQKQSFGQILEVVERYVNASSSQSATDEINTILAAPVYVAAQVKIDRWISANCT